MKQCLFSCVRQAKLSKVFEHCVLNKHNDFNLFERSFVCYQNCEHDILNMNEPILMPITTSGPQGRAEMINLGRQEVKGQGHARPKVALEAWRMYYSRPPWVELFFSSSMKCQKAFSSCTVSRSISLVHFTCSKVNDICTFLNCWFVIDVGINKLLVCNSRRASIIQTPN